MFGRRPLVFALMATALVPRIFAVPYQTLMPVFQKNVPQGRSRRIGSFVGGAGLGRDGGRPYAGDLRQSRKTTGSRDARESSFPRDRYEPVLLDRLDYHGDSGVDCHRRLASILHGDNQHNASSDRPRSFARACDEYLMHWIRGLMPVGALMAGVSARVIGAPATVSYMGLVVILLAILVTWRAPVVRDIGLYRAGS